MDGIIEGHEFIKSNPEEAAEAVSSYIQGDTSGALVYFPENITAMWGNNTPKYTLWCEPGILVEMSETAAEIVQINLNLTLDQLYDLSFEEKLKDAQNEIYPNN